MTKRLNHEQQFVYNTLAGYLGTAIPYSQLTNIQIMNIWHTIVNNVTVEPTEEVTKGFDASSFDYRVAKDWYFGQYKLFYISKILMSLIDVSSIKSSCEANLIFKGQLADLAYNGISSDVLRICIAIDEEFAYMVSLLGKQSFSDTCSLKCGMTSMIDHNKLYYYVCNEHVVNLRVRGVGFIHNSMHILKDISCLHTLRLTGAITNTCRYSIASWEYCGDVYLKPARDNLKKLQSLPLEEYIDCSKMLIIDKYKWLGCKWK